METLADIVREMRKGSNQSWWDIDREWAHDLADRVDAAAKQKEINRIADIARECAKVKEECEAENAKLRAALKPVLDYKFPR